MNIISALTFCWFVSTVVGWRPFEIKITNQTSHSCDTKRVTINSTLNIDGSMNMDVELLNEIPDVFVLCQINVDSGSGKYDLQLLNKTISLCRLVRDPRYEPIIQIMYKVAKQYGNFPKTCPILKQKYFIKDLVVKADMLPPVFPEKNLFIQMSFLSVSFKKLSEFSAFVVIAKQYQKPKIE